QAVIVTRPGARRALCPVVEAAGRHLQTPAHQPDRVLVAVASDHLVPQGDSLAKNAAASRKKSRSFFTRASSRFRVATSSSRGTPAPGNGFRAPLSNCLRHRHNRSTPIPRSRATWLALAPGSWIKPTASRLNSSLNFLRCDMALLLPHDEASLKCPCYRGRTPPTPRPGSWRRSPPPTAAATSSPPPTPTTAAACPRGSG